MKLELTFYQRGVGATFDQSDVIYHEIWVASALRIAWKIWTGLGWKSPGTKPIEASEWFAFTGDELKLSLMDKIARFNRITSAKNSKCHVEKDFGDDWLLILEIISWIKNQNFHFEPCEEVDRFRDFVTRFIACSLRRGFSSDEVVNSEYFIFTADEHLDDYPIIYADGIEVSFLLFAKTATATATCQNATYDCVECDNITVELK